MYTQSRAAGAARSVTLENFEAEAKTEAVRAARRQKLGEKIMKQRQDRENAIKASKAARDEEAKQLVSKMQKEGTLRAFPTF